MSPKQTDCIYETGSLRTLCCCAAIQGRRLYTGVHYPVNRVALQDNCADQGDKRRQGPHLSIRIGIPKYIWILPSDTLFGDDLNCICFDYPNRETAMLSR